LLMSKINSKLSHGGEEIIEEDSSSSTDEKESTEEDNAFNNEFIDDGKRKQNQRKLSKNSKDGKDSKGHKEKITNPKDVDFFDKFENFQPEKDKDGKYLMSDHTFLKEQRNSVNYRVNPEEKGFSEAKHIENILHLSETYTMSTSKVSTNSCLSVLDSNCGLFLKCGRCKKVSFDAVEFVTLQENYQKLYYFGSFCPNCFVNIYVIIVPILLHQSNTTRICNIFCMNCEPLDYMPSGFRLTCASCMQENELSMKITNVLPFSNKTVNCGICNYGNYNFLLENIAISSSSILATEYLDFIVTYKKSMYFSNFTQKISFFNYNKPFYVIPSEKASGLPKDGSCLHYKSMNKWSRCRTCYKMYPCYLCHNEVDNSHVFDIYRNICGFCCHEDVDGGAMSCYNCKKVMVRDSNSNYWEGGKGQNSKIKMSKKDNHKYTGISERQSQIRKRVN